VRRPLTVDIHRRQIFTKIGISSRAEIQDIDLTADPRRGLPTS
jgi:hypothetical protein